MDQQADVVAERDGRITAVKVEIGDHVRRGEVLALLDDRALQAARAEKAAKLDSLRAQIQPLEAARTSHEADLRRAAAMRVVRQVEQGYKLLPRRSCGAAAACRSWTNRASRPPSMAW